MKGKLLIVLILLMIFSLVGIIFIQSNWISSSIAYHQAELKNHVNDALNDVNNELENKKARLYIEQELGGMDTIVNRILIESIEQKNATIQYELESDLTEENEIIRINDASNGNDKIIRIESSINQGGVKSDSLKNQNIRTIQRKIIENDSVIEESIEHVELNENDINRMEQLIERQTLQSIWHGQLTDRLQLNELQYLIDSTLKLEGIEAAFDFGVYNNVSNAFESALQTKNFDTTTSVKNYMKSLFPQEKGRNVDADLILQLHNETQFVWTRIKGMVVLSILFTLLIVFAFAMALYYIFKQKKVSRVKNDFINNMTHELKTPLASISLATASIKHPSVLNNSKEVLRLANIIETEKNRMNNHIERVLETASLDAGTLVLSFDSYQLSEILKQAIEKIQLTLDSVGGTINLNLDDQLTLEADRFHLINVFTNILDNSIKYAGENNPYIVISCHLSGPMINISIEDNGIGMTAKEQKHAFDTFYRAETGDIHTQKGFGLGLSYVKSIIEKHQGTIAIDSKKHHGTKLIIQLPKHQS